VDAPGHKIYTPKITDAATQVDRAELVISARKEYFGITQNVTKSNGINEVVVAINETSERHFEFRE
jgi:translation elongation factor EF-1alpha